MKLAYKLKSEIIEHRNYIGGRYSVLSEVGMVPAELMGLDIKKFKRLNHLINNKKFMHNIIRNVSAISLFAKRKKTQMFNGYGEYVSYLYAGMDLKKFY